MPNISMFYGIIIYLCFKDNRRHKSPHIHAKYQEYKVVVSIPEAWKKIQAGHAKQMIFSEKGFSVTLCN